MMKKVFVQTPIILAFGLAISMLNFTSSAYAAEWSVPNDFATIQAAIDDLSVNDGDKILVGPGSHAGALVNKSVEIKGIDGAVINNGPVHGSGLIQGFRLLAGSDGCTISHFRFIEPVALTIMNGAAVSEVTVTHNKLINQIQGISNWAGSGWEISQNEIVDLHTRCGGGIGILVGTWNTSHEADNNVVSHNKIYGTLVIPEGDCGGYNGTGIVLYNDRRFGSPGGVSVANNRIVKNNISLVADDQGSDDGVGVVAIELTDTGEGTGVIFDNAIGFNDVRDTTLSFAFTPEALEDENDVSRNLGQDNNRGHGLHPNIFGPGGN